MEWMHGGGRDPNGRGLDEEIRIGKEDWMERQRVANSNPLGFPGHMIHEYEGGQLSPEEFYQHQSIPQSERPLTGAQGGRVEMKPGGLVEPGVTHYGRYPTPGMQKETYTGDFKTWYETTKIKGETPVEKYGPFKDLTKGQRGTIKSRDYKRWLERTAELKDIRKTGHIPLEEFFEKHGVPDHYRTQMEHTGTSGRRKFNRDWFKKNLEKYVVNLEFSQAGGRGLFIKDPGKKLTKEFIKVFNTPDVTLRPKTVINMNKLWRAFGDSHFSKGTYPPLKEVVKALGGKLDMTPHAAAGAVRRISQIMTGTNFIGTNGKYVSTNIVPDKKMGVNIIKKFQGEDFHTAYGSANYKINMGIISENLPKYTETQNLETMKQHARKILRKHDIPIYVKNKTAGFNINELTGTGSAAQHKSFTSSQFINLMEGKFNQTKHAGMLRVYGEHEGRLKAALSGPKPDIKKANAINAEWKAWKKNWIEGLDSKIKDNIVKSGLPGFDLRANAAQKRFSSTRLAELMNLGLDVVGESEKARYLKTFTARGNPQLMEKTPVLKELVDNPNATIKMLRQVGYRCKQDEGGVESVACYLRDARNQLKSVKNRSPGMGRKLARLRNFGKKALLWGLGPVDIVIEALFAQHGIASGHGKDQLWADSIIGMIIPQSLGGPEWGDEIRLDKIAELGGEEYANALNQEKEFNNILDKYYDVDKIPADIRGHSTKGYKEKLYADLDKEWEEYEAGQEYLTVPKDARPTQLDEKGDPLLPRNLGPQDQVMKWSQDLNPDSFAAEKFRIANEKLQAQEAATGQASGVPKVRLETQEAENIRKTRDIGEHPRGDDYWTEFFRTLRGWDPAWRGPEGTGYSFRQEGMDYMARGGIAGLLKK